MQNDLTAGKWLPVETQLWQRRAYGRKIVLESEGGTLRARLEPGEAAPQLDLRGDIRGRMLIQLYANGRMILDEMLAHEELESFVDLRPYIATGAAVDLELHAIPAPCGSIKMAQSLNALAEPVVPGMAFGHPAELGVI